MKITRIYMAAVSMLLIAAACNKQEAQLVEENQEAQELTNNVTISGIWDDATKATVTDGGVMAWTATTDKVAYHTTGGWLESGGADASADKANFEVVDGSRDYWAVYPSSIVLDSPDKGTKYGQPSTALSVLLPDTYELGSTNLVSNSDVHLCCPMIADNTQPVADGWFFRQLCGLFRMTVNCIPPSVNKITVDFGHPVAGQFDIPAGVAVGSSTIGWADGVTGKTSNVITITFDAAGGTTWRDNITFNLPWPTGEYGDITIKMYNGTTEVISMTRPAGKTGAYTAARAHGRKVAAGFPIFSVSASKRVVIAPSNLQLKRDASYAAGDGTAWAADQSLVWSFMTNPWDYVEGDETPDSKKWKTVSGSGTLGYDIDYNKKTTISLFGWGATGYDWAGHGFTVGTDYGAAYQPWSVSATNSDYGPIWGNSFGNNNLTGVFEPGDWGKVAGTLAGFNTWRLLNKNEWNYLLETRTGDKQALGWVNGMKGGILLPDNFVDPMLNGGNSAIVCGPNTLDSNVYTEEQWKGMAANGAIFLPGCAFRMKGGTGYATDIRWYNYGFYHVSDAYSATHNWDLAVRFDATYGVPMIKVLVRDGRDKYMGKNIRLARPIQ